MRKQLETCQRHLAAGAADAEVPLINYLAAAMRREIGNQKKPAKVSQARLQHPRERLPLASRPIATDPWHNERMPLSTLLRLRKPRNIPLFQTINDRLPTPGDWSRLADLLPGSRPVFLN